MKRGLALILAFLCVLSLCPAHGDEDASARLAAAREYLISAFPAPEYGSEWVVYSLAISDGMPEDMREHYLSTLTDGLASGFSKSTDAARVVLALTRLELDARDYEGQDLTVPLTDFAFSTKQGLNGACYALLALDAGDYPGDVRAEYIEFILGRQLADGGWALRGDVSDTDMTAIALQALAPYRDEPDIADAIEKGLDRLASLQRENGGYASYGTECSESTSQVLIALAVLDRADDERFSGVLSALLAYALPSGGFSHLPGDAENVLATCQAIQALTYYTDQE